MNFSFLFFYIIIFYVMEKKNTEKTMEDLIKFVENENFVYWDFGDYERNVRIMSDAVQLMWWSWYIEEMWPALDESSLYCVADYYDSIVNDVIVFDTEIRWNFQMSAQEVAEYLWNMNERYEDVRKKYESMYTASQIIKQIKTLFKS